MSDVLDSEAVDGSKVVDVMDDSNVVDGSKVVDVIDDSDVVDGSAVHPDMNNANNANRKLAPTEVRMLLIRG